MSLSERGGTAAQPQMFSAEVVQRVAGLCQQALSAPSSQRAMQQAVQGLVQDLGYFSASVGLIDTDREFIVVSSAWCGREEVEGAAGYRQSIEQGVAGRAIATGVAVYVEDVSVDPDYLALFEGARSELCIPLTVGSDVIGVLDINSEHIQGFSEGELQLLGCLAAQLAQVLEKHRLLQEVVETRDYLEGLVESAGDAIITTDLEGRVQRWNLAAEEMFGCPKEQMLGAPMSALWSAAEAEEAQRLFRHVAHGNGIRQHQTRGVRAGGASLDVLVTLSPIHGAAGEVVSVSCIVRDVSDRVKMESRFAEMHRKVVASEEKYRSLLQHNQEAIFLLEPSTLAIQETNPCAARLVGRSPATLIGVSWPDLAQGEEAENARGYLERAAAGAGSPAHEVRLRTADNRRVILEISASLVRAGQEAHLQILGRNVTERRQAETEREALRLRLMQSEKLSVMGELLSGVAHELNNPLTGVIGYAQLLMNQSSAEPLRRNLERIQEEAQRCHKIVQNLLGFARQRRAEKVKVELNRVLDETLDLRSYQMRVDNIWVVKDFHPDLPLVEGDPHQLQQVFINLVTNAHQALVSAGRGGVLTVTTRPRRGHVEIRLADNGPGIPEEIRTKIFEPFFTTKGVGQGTGLGLSICHGIIQDHAGRLSVSSQPGVETAFVIELPTGEDGSLRIADKPSPAAEPPQPAEINERPRRVLVVDDEGSIREFLEEALRSRGHEVDTAANGLLALDRMRDTAYDAVITDLKMPGMNGRQLYEELRKAHPEVASRVIFATGDLVATDTLEFLQSTGNPYLEKPFSIRSIAEALDGLDQD